MLLSTEVAMQSERNFWLTGGSSALHLKNSSVMHRNWLRDFINNVQKNGLLGSETFAGWLFILPQVMNFKFIKKYTIIDYI